MWAGVGGVPRIFGRGLCEREQPNFVDGRFDVELRGAVRQ